ncbi:MAG: DUF4394 domain-containing protein [Williamsia sp.]|nr:DUF4394 domain-containing protein [Williamsia sp.]
MRTRTQLGILLCALLFLFSSCEKAMQESAAANPDQVFVALTKDLVLQTYNANDLSKPQKSVQVTGLESAETILGIDYRPANGLLYALGNTSRIYIINQMTGVATALGSKPFIPALSGIIAGFDFSPREDLIRIVTTTGQNLRVHPETGVVQNVDNNINGAAGVQISGSAYTEPTRLPSFTPELYAIDVVAKKLYKQSPLAGTLTEQGSLTIPNSSGETGFDISYTGIALAAITSGNSSGLYQINLSNGATTALGTFPDKIIGLAMQAEPVAYVIGFRDTTYTAYQITALTPERPSPGGSLSNLPPGETIVAIDFRPSTGQLYGLGRTSRLYTIDLTTLAVKQVGNTQFSPLLSGTNFGFDFNPAADRIRVVSNTGQNLRLDPNTGLVAAVDANLNPGSPSVSAAAYTNNFSGASSTTLYTIDHVTDCLYRQDPPNNGVLTLVGPLGVDILADNGFDITGTTGTAYAFLTTTGVFSDLYSINLSTGKATYILTRATAFGICKGLAIGTGF